MDGRHCTGWPAWPRNPAGPRRCRLLGAAPRLALSSAPAYPGQACQARALAALTAALGRSSCGCTERSRALTLEVAIADPGSGCGDHAVALTRLDCVCRQLAVPPLMRARRSEPTYQAQLPSHFTEHRDRGGMSSPM